MSEAGFEPIVFPPSAKLIVFDPNITRTSPAGSCVLTMLQPLVEKCAIHLFITRTDLPDAKLMRKIRIPTPRRPVFVSAFLFTFLSVCAYVFRRRPKGLRISTEGAFPFCDVCYAHSCHHVLLFRYRHHLGGGRLRRVARILTHTWGAITERMAFRYARTIVVPSQGLARDLRCAYPKLVEGKIQTISNPVDTEAFRKPLSFSHSQTRGQIGISGDAFVLSFCALGNFERKGLPLLLDALAKSKHTRVELIVIGGLPADVREYRAVSEQLGVNRRVHFVGLQNDIRAYLWSSDTFAFPSLHETFPLVCLQAAAAGLPLITTNLHGVEEFMIHGETGWIIDRAVSSVQSAIEDAASNRERTAQMGRAANARVQMYSQKRFQQRWMELLKEELTAH